MRVVFVGTGVMGLSAAATLSRRGHHVVAVDRFGVGNRSASSPGATRIWRMAHPDRTRVRLAAWTKELWRDLEARTGRTILLERGLLWRGGEVESVAAALRSEGVAFEFVDEQRQQELFPELRWKPGLQVIWQPDAGAVIATEALAASAQVLQESDGRLLSDVSVTAITPGAGGGVRVESDAGEFDADVAVVTAGPWAGPLLARVGIEVDLHPVLEQVTYVRGGSSGGENAWEQRPCVIDVPEDASSFGFYAMPTPGVGYKVGLDDPLRDFDPGDLDRSPDSEREREALDRVRLDLPGLDPTLVRSEVCTWTDSPDSQFILDRVGDVVVGCGDSGQAFKFHPMFGEVIADLVEGKPGHPDTVGFSVSRFG